MRTFSALLAEHRQAAGWSQGDVAAAVNVNRSTITRLESGHRAPSHQMAVALADALELSLVERVMFLASAGFAETHVIAELVARAGERRYTWEIRL